MKETKVAGIRYKKYGSGKKREAAVTVGHKWDSSKMVVLAIREEGKSIAHIHLTAKKACKLGMILLDGATEVDSEVIR